MNELFWIFVFTQALLMFAYMSYAKKNRILDIPNDRSSHVHEPVRGLGIVFLSAVIFSFYFIPASHWKLLTALLVAGVTGYLDDRLSLSVWTRLFMYALICALLTLQIIGNSFVLDSELIWFIAILVLMLGIVNAFNFMDGINGITALYALVTIFSLYYFPINELHSSFPLGDLMIVVLVFFLFVNLRKNTLAFMGDAGSIMLGALCAFLVLGMVYRHQDISYLLLLSVYGVDSLATITIRLINKENIATAHRTHAYQLLANEAGWGHIPVSVLYAIVQLIINFLLYQSLILHQWNSAFLMAIVLISLILLYFAVKFRYHK